MCMMHYYNYSFDYVNVYFQVSICGNYGSLCIAYTHTFFFINQTFDT